MGLVACGTGNYAAFHVDEPFSEGNAGAHSARDFCYYNLLRVWKDMDPSFPFLDSHGKGYDVRDGSDWEGTLEARIRGRLRDAQNLVLFLSSATKDSRALREEMDYGVNDLGLPVIVVYPDYRERSDIANCESNRIRKEIEDLWGRLPGLRELMERVPTIHVPNKKQLIRHALETDDFKADTRGKPGISFYPC